MSIKNNRILCGTILSILFLFALPTQKASAQYENTYLSYTDFYEDLANYGQWIEDAQYGFVWSPDVDGSFRPYYTNGHWIMTNYGNTWVSDYPWGWACFHYGRWTYDGYYGWLWIPGNNWGPAWVAWRYGEGFYGWAPLDPTFEFGNAYREYGCPSDWWVFIPPKYMYSGNYYRYWNGPRNNAHLVHNTTFANNTYVHNDITYVTGPRTREIEGLTHQPVQIFKVTNSQSRITHIHNDDVKMFRPAEIRPAASSIDGKRVTPPNFVAAPQQINKPQPVNGNTATPRYRGDVPRNTRSKDAVGTHFNEPVKETPPQRSTVNPYDWDVNKDVRENDKHPVDEPRQPVQEVQPVPAPQQPSPQPAPQTRPQPTNQPQPKPQPVRGQPAQPAKQPVQRESGGR